MLTVLREEYEDLESDDESDTACTKSDVPTPVIVPMVFIIA